MSIPHDVRQAYGLGANETELEIEHIPSNINQTYVVRKRRDAAGPPLVLQRLHPVFGPEVHIDIEAVTAHLLARGLDTPRLIRTQAGELWTVDASAAERRVWRALSYVDGVTLQNTRDPAPLESAAALLGRFHDALLDLEHAFVHERPLHDTPRHLAKLEAVLASAPAAGDSQAQALGAEVLSHAETLRLDFSDLPKRTIHGDPKLSNVMFEREAPALAKCMIDLDTVGRGYLAYELGDALRSWCNPAGEDSTHPEVAPEVFAAVMRGYASRCPRNVSAPEFASALDGFETVSAELASRFAADVISDSYFGWDSSRFSTRREHNLMRAKGQLALSRAVRAQRSVLANLAERELGAIARG